MCQAEKETRESHYWLRLIRDSFAAFKSDAAQLLDRAEELKRILAAITKSTKS